MREKLLKIAQWYLEITSKKILYIGPPIYFNCNSMKKRIILARMDAN